MDQQQQQQRLFYHLSSLYKNPKDFPGAFKGIVPFRQHLLERQRKGTDPELRGHILSPKLLQKWREYEDTYSRYKDTPRRHKIPRRPYKILNPNAIWEGDLLDMRRWKSKRGNDNTGFILVLVDQFTRKLYAAPCKSKSGRDVLQALKQIFESDTLSRPRILYTDNGLEFTNKDVQDYLVRVLKIRHVTTTSQYVKSAIAERTNRTLKRVLTRVASVNNGTYIPSLRSVVSNYNMTKHSAIGIAPDSVDPLNVDDVRQEMYTRQSKRRKQQFGTKATWDTNPRRPLLAVGDWVRIANRKRDVFKRGYDPTFSKELYYITKVNIRDGHITYSLANINNDNIPSEYNYPELSKTVLPVKFKIENYANSRQFTDTLDPQRTKYKQIKIEQYAWPVWIPDSVLASARSAEDKRSHTIPSRLFLHWLRS